MYDMGYRLLEDRTERPKNIFRNDENGGLLSMKKKIIALAMCIVLGAASMVACGDSKKDSDTDTE